MKQSHVALRLTLLVVLLSLVITVLVLFGAPELIARFYPGTAFPDTAHRHLLMAIGAMSMVFTVGTLLAFFRPVKNAGIVTLLILMHFGIFVMDVVLLAQGTDLPWRYLLPEMAYALIVCTLLVRFYPVRTHGAELAETADVLVDTFQSKLKSKEKQEEAVKREEERQRKDLEKKIRAEVKEEQRKKEAS